MTEDKNIHWNVANLGGGKGINNTKEEKELQRKWLDSTDYMKMENFWKLKKIKNVDKASKIFIIYGTETNNSISIQRPLKINNYEHSMKTWG